MSKESGDDAKARLIPLGSCTWCGHKPHNGQACGSKIRVQRHRKETLREVPCPCARAKAAA